MHRSILIVLLVIPTIICQCSVERAQPYFKRSINEFTTKLLIRLAEENENHFVTSTFSPWALITALSLGASGETLREIKEVLRLHPHKCFNDKFFEIGRKVCSNSIGTTLERSSVMFVDRSLPLKDVFKNKIKKTEISSVETIAFEDTNNAAVTINDYVNRVTHGNVDDIVAPNDLDGALLVLIDALYFKGSWTNKFSDADTEISAFYNENGEQIGDVNLMYTLQDLNYTKVVHIGATVVELPYGSGNRFSMLFILPEQEDTVPTVLQKMKNISLSTIFTLFRTVGTTSVQVQIPKFEINSDLDNLKELLEDMGLVNVFSSSADFSEISDYPLYISAFVQKATIEVNEEGAEASAATDAQLSGRSLVVPVQFLANKPFIFMIVDKEFEIPLFSGAYSKPVVV